MTTTTRKYYAVYNPYGVHVLNRDGIKPNWLIAFTMRADRDQAVRVDPGHVESVRYIYAREIMDGRMPVDAPDGSLIYTFLEK